MEKVLVLLSTFNGEKYLETQIQSVLAQNHPNLDILIRDDGSSDDTRQILRSFEKQYAQRVQVVYAENVGYRNSFFELMEKAPPAYDFYAFCDQDDYWLPEKISRAIRVLKPLDQQKPLLYCSALTLTDKDLKPIGQAGGMNRATDYRQYFFSSIPTGSTSVFNDRLRRTALSGKALARNHDSWMLIVASFFGEIFVDQHSFILYRQHENNALGLQLSPLRKFAGKLARIVKKDVKFSNISSFAGLFLENYSYLMSEDQKKFVKTIAGYRQSVQKTLRLALSKEITTSHWYDTLAIRILVLMRYI